MASALIFWKYHGISARADLGVGDDALKAVTHKINSALKALEERKGFLEKAVDELKVKDCPDYKARESFDGTVVVVSGQGHHKVGEYVVYETKVYRCMTLDRYKELKEEKKLPVPDYTTYLARSAFDVSWTDDNNVLHIVNHSDVRYGSNNECPPGEYYLNCQKDAGGGRFTMYVSDSETGKKIVIKEDLQEMMDNDRKGIAIHKYNPGESQGCLTTVSGSDNDPVMILYNNLPDLILHREEKVMLDRRPVRIIIEEREVTEEVWEDEENGTIKWKGVV